MPAKYNNERSGEFHEIHQKQSSSNSVPQPPTQHDISNKIVKSELESQVNPRIIPKQRISACWSSSSSLSSLTTDSLFSLPDSPSAPMKCKRTGVLFGNLDLVPFDPKVDPEPHACYNCWHFDHECQDCPDIKIDNYCRNCGRRGVAMNECPRCARAYMDYVDRSYKHCEVFVSRMEVDKSVDDIQLNIVEESYHESWVDFEDDQKSCPVSYLETLKKRGKGYQYDDWNEYENPRVSPVKKSSKLFSLNATKAEVAKYKDDHWSDCEVVNYSWGEYSYKTKGRSFIDPEERTNKVEDWDYFEQDTVDFSQNQFGISTTSENVRAEYQDEQVHKNCFSANNKTANWIIIGQSKVVGEIVSDGKCEESLSGICNSTDCISSINASSVKLEIKDQNSNIPQNNNIQDDKEDWSDSEAYQSFQASFGDESETGNHLAALNNTIDEEYWTDFDDDYESLQASFAEEYKSLDNTMEDESDCTNTFADELFSFVKNEKEDDLFIAKQNGYQVNSLTSSVGSQSDEAYLSNDEDVEDYDYMIVDESERSESVPFAGQAVQEFLNLLENMKHLPIQTQNIAVLHFISKQKEQAWQD